jgi:adhesin transport system outer membrane protein
MLAVFKTITGLLLPLFLVSAFAETNHLPNLLQEAVSQHPDVRNRKNERLAAGSQLDGAKWGRFPSVSAESQTYSDGPQTVAKVELPLWNGGRITGQINVASAGLTLADAAVQVAEQTVLTQAATAFFEILRLESRLKTAIQNEAEHLRLLQIIQRRAESEVSPKADETQADARMRQAIADRIQTKRQLEAARLALEQAVGRPVAELAAPSRVGMARWTEASLLQAALAFSPERKRLQAQVETSEAQIDVARAQLMPTVVAGFQRQVGPLAITGDARERAYIGLQVQTGAGLSSLSNVQVAISRKLAAQDAIVAHDRQLTHTVRSTWSESVAMAEQLAPVRALLAGSDEIVASYLRQFQVSRKSWLDVLNAQREKIQAYNALADIEYPLMLSQVKLLLLAGQLNASSQNITDER